MNNSLEVYAQNSKSLMVYVGGISDLTAYSPYLTVKKRAKDSTALLSKAGIVSDPSTTYIFSLTTSDTSIAAGDYVYDITLTQGAEVITIVKDRFSVLDTVRY